MNFSSNYICKSNENLNRTYHNMESVPDSHHPNAHLHKDTTYTKIFVGGLPYHTTDDTLKTYFEFFGELEEAVVITDRQTGKSRGYGFVTMRTSEDAMKAIKDPNPCIDGRKTNVNLAILGAKPRNVPSMTSTTENINPLGNNYGFNQLLLNNYSNPLINFLYPSLPSNQFLQPLLSQCSYPNVSYPIINHPLHLPPSCYISLPSTPTQEPIFTTNGVYNTNCKLPNSPSIVPINSGNNILLKSQQSIPINLPFVQLKSPTAYYQKSTLNQ